MLHGRTIVLLGYGRIGKHLAPICQALGMNVIGVKRSLKPEDEQDAHATVRQTKELKEGFRCYPLAQANNPPKQKVIDLSGKQFNTIHANDEHFYEELNEVIQYEPSEAFEPQILGLFKAIGIEKGKDFAAKIQKDKQEADKNKGVNESVTQLANLAKMKEDGILTEEEFETMKKKIIQE